MRFNHGDGTPELETLVASSGQLAKLRLILLLIFLLLTIIIPLPFHDHNTTDNVNNHANNLDKIPAAIEHHDDTDKRSPINQNTDDKNKDTHLPDTDHQTTRIQKNQTQERDRLRPVLQVFRQVPEIPRKPPSS
jgi:hypothetical protein